MTEPGRFRQFMQQRTQVELERELAQVDREEELEVGEIEAMLLEDERPRVARWEHVETDSPADREDDRNNYPFAGDM